MSHIMLVGRPLQITWSAEKIDTFSGIEARTFRCGKTTFLTRGGLKLIANQVVIVSFWSGKTHCE